ncbi:MAG: hypothetical protein GC182_21455 [Rhodopseudomonas sp.]|nr:hypothetical protein [Rhodopseudomonas sp.]
MSILLFGAGGLAFLAGVGMIAYGVPINEFSFGNTLITSGTIAIMGGLLVVGLGAVVTYLRRVLDALANAQPTQNGAAFKSYEQAAPAQAAGSPRVPFPTKSKSEAKSSARAEARYEPDQHGREPVGFEPMPASFGTSFNDPNRDYYAPSLPNPDEPPVTVDEDVSLSPRHPTVPTQEFGDTRLSPPPGLAFSIDPTELDELRDQRPKRDNNRRAPLPRSAPVGRSLPPEAPALPERPGPSDWSPPVERSLPPQRAAQPSPATPSLPQARPAPGPFFDQKWPPEPTVAEPSSTTPQWDSSPPPVDEPPEPVFDHQPEDARPDDEPRSVAILKSGVVDGMGYTLYVDGSIEAELPQGTLRFASITDLRQHLEKTS